LRWSAYVCSRARRKWRWSTLCDRSANSGCFLQPSRIDSHPCKKQRRSATRGSTVACNSMVLMHRYRGHCAFTHGFSCPLPVASHPAILPPMQLSKTELLRRLYSDPAYIQTAHIIGYGGCGPFEFWDAAKHLPCDHQGEFRDAMFDLTRTDRREASPPRYELREDVKKLCWQLLGPPPGHPLREEMDKLKEPPAEPAPVQAEEGHAEKVKKSRKTRGKGR
jgi:hypothetical protein